jgi:hypothetical protein
MVGYGTDGNPKNNFTVFRNGVARVAADPKDIMDVVNKKYVDGLIDEITELQKNYISKTEGGTIVFPAEEYGNPTISLSKNGIS